MHRFTSIIFSYILLCGACRGTEVGNGVQPTPTPTPTETPDTADKATAKTSSPESSPTGNNSKISTEIPIYILVACASPLADPILGKFIEQTSALTFRVASGQEDERLIFEKDSQTAYKSSPKPTATNPFAISPTAISPDLSCGQVTSQTLSNGTLQRTVLLSDKTQLSWILENQTVVKITIKLESSTQIWSKMTD